MKTQFVQKKTTQLLNDTPNNIQAITRQEPL